MKNLINSEGKTELEIIEVNPKKIIFKTTYSWAFGLNANHEDKIRYFSLSNNFLNRQKLQKIVPSYKFSKTVPDSLLVNSSLPQLRNYQTEDVKFLSKLKSIAIFSEMRTGKTPTALMTFQK